MWYLPFTINHQGFFHSVGRNPSLNCLHRRRSLAIVGHAGPRWRIRLSLYLVLGLPCRLVHSRGDHSVTLFVHLLSLNRAMCPVHPCNAFLIMSMILFTPVWCRIQVLRLWSSRVMPSMTRALLRYATDSSSMWAFFSAHVSLPYTMTGNTYSLCTFLCVIYRIRNALDINLSYIHPGIYQNFISHFLLLSCSGHSLRTDNNASQMAASAPLTLSEAVAVRHLQLSVSGGQDCDVQIEPASGPEGAVSGVCLILSMGVYFVIIKGTWNPAVKPLLAFLKSFNKMYSLCMC